MPVPNETARTLKHYLESEHTVVEGNPIPKKVDKNQPETPKKEQPKNDEYNEYEYSDNTDEDDKNW